MKRLKQLLAEQEDQIVERAFKDYMEELVGECDVCHRAIPRDEWSALHRLGIRSGCLGDLKHRLGITTQIGRG